MSLYDLRSDIRRYFSKAVLYADNIIYTKSGGDKRRHLFSRSCEIPFVGSSVRVLRKTDEEIFIEKTAPGDFKIMGSTDFHLDTVYDTDNKTIAMFMKQIKEEKPDLIVLTGDIFTNKHPVIDAVQFAEMMEKTGVYWCCVYGNHECREEFSIFKYSIFKCISSYPHCLTRVGSRELFGVGNYSVNIMNNGKLLKTLYMFDSGRNIIDSYCAEHGCSADLKGYDFLKKNQIEWYRRTSAKLKKVYGTNSSLMFMHIPLCEYANVNDFLDGKYEPSGKCNIFYGSQYESVGCSPINSGMFDAVCECGTQAVFSGHDHINDFCAEYKGIKLVYLQPMGYSTYNLGTNCGFDEKDWINGVTVINIDKNGNIDISRQFNSKFLK